MEQFMSLFNQIGPWAIVLVCLAVLARFTNEQIKEARIERREEEEQHTNEVTTLSQAITSQSEKFAEALNNNTQAIIKLAALIERNEKP